MSGSVVAVVFDLDGTLVDSRADIAAAANFSLVQHGFLAHPEAVIGGFVGDGATNLLIRAAGIPSQDPRFPAVLQTFLDYYARHAADHTVLMPGSLEAIDALAGIDVAVLTNKPRGPTEALLDALGIASRFQVVVAGGDLQVLKPDPQPLLFVAEQLGCPIASVAMVGDGPQDIECGRAAGARTIGVKGGIASLQRLVDAQPDRLIESLFELPQAIASLRR